MDVIIVSFNSREHLRATVAPLAAPRWAHVVVVDNASADGSIEAVRGLDVHCVSLPSNGGFARGCNIGFRTGRSPYVLFLNPDARIEPQSLEKLVQVLDENATLGAVGPQLLDEEGALEHSQRLFQRPSTILAQALFLHRVFPEALWADDAVHDTARYEQSQPVEWLPAACLLVRRNLLERLDGFDEGFFHYCEDMDLCRRMRGLGMGIRYEPKATAIHIGGQSAPRASLLPQLTASKIRYARKHHGRLGGWLHRLALIIHAGTHTSIPGSTRRAERAGYRHALSLAIRGRRASAI